MLSTAGRHGHVERNSTRKCCVDVAQQYKLCVSPCRVVGSVVYVLRRVAASPSSVCVS
jgi:hypothetical protein